MINRGVDLVVSGGTEAPIGPYALTCQLTNGRLSEADDPKAAYRPFDARANGYVPGEGGAIIVVEGLDHAEGRGAPVYGEIVGYGATNDASDPRESQPDGRHLARAMSLALERAGVAASEIDAVFLDAMGTPEADAAEVDAIRQVFGERAEQVPVTAPKSMVGRLYAGGAPLDVAAALLAIRDGVLPPTINLDQAADGAALDFVRGEAREAQVDTVLVNARGFGGFNSALVLRRRDSGSP
jgi:3-oxoacyl-(acyl-carrier-protein) synthase